MNRAGRVLVALVAVGIGAAVVGTAPQIEDVTRPIAFTGSVGDRISGRVFAATVTEVRLADRLRLKDGTVVSTPGVFVLVEARVTPRLANVSLQDSRLRVDGAEYAAYDDPASSDLSGAAGQAGLTVEGSIAFEVPRAVEHAAAGQIVLSRGSLNPDEVAVVGIAPDRLDRVDRADIVPVHLVTTESP